MYRGWIKDWRKTEDSLIWSMPPLHYKVWKWILYKADHKTGVLKTSIQRIAEGVEWEEYGCPRTPNKKTISRILDWLQDENMVSRESNGKGNATYTSITVINWDTYQNTEQEKVTAKVTENTLKNTLKKGHSTRSTRIEPELKEEERTLKHMSADADAPVLPGFEMPSDNGKARTQEIEAVFAHYRAKIHPEARLLEKARTKIRVRLNTFSTEDLCRAVDKFSADTWRMENNARLGIAWFFRSDDQVEQFLNLVPRETGSELKCPICGQPGKVHPDGKARCSGKEVHGWTP